MQIIKTERGCNGCGFAAVSQIMPDFEFGKVCDKHDYDTFDGGDILTYLQINLLFYVGLLTVISDSTRPLFQKVLLFLYGTFMGVYVFFFNWLFFDWHKVK